MLTVIGGLLGCATGLVVWLVARWYTLPSRALRSEQGPAPRTGSPRRGPGGAALSVALTLGCMGAWGAYVGWRLCAFERVALALLLTGMLVALSWVDFRVRRLPNPLLLALLSVGLVQALWLKSPTLGSAALGLLAGGGLFFVLALLGRGAMGVGDAKLASVLGAVLGFPLVLPGLLYGTLAGGAAALLLLATRRAGRKDPMAYGPYLALGAWIVWTQAFGLWP